MSWFLYNRSFETPSLPKAEGVFFDPKKEIL